jgi:hypothetical protein
MKSSSQVIIATFSLFFLYLFSSCSEKKATGEKEITMSDSSTDTVQEQAALPEKQLIPGKTLLVVNDFDFEKNQNRLQIFSFDPALEKTVLNEDIDLAPSGGMLSSSKYNSTGSLYPVQFNASLSKIYYSIFKSDEMEGIFDWCKLMEYDTKTKATKEIASFNDNLNAWIYSENTEKIYCFEPVSSALLSFDLTNPSIDTLFKSKMRSEELDYQLRDDKLEVYTFTKNPGLSRVTIDLNSSTVKDEFLLKLHEFSSFQGNCVIEMFSDFKGVNEIRLYENDNRKTLSFDFRNFKTYWTDANHFTVTAENSLKLFSKNLNIQKEINLEGVHVIDKLDNYLLISYGKAESPKGALLSLDFKKVIDIQNIDPRMIVYAK